MKIEEGTIIAIKEAGSAEIKVGRHSDCIACGACDGADNIVVTAVDPLGVKVGQHVRFEFRDVNIVIGAFICFVMPLLVCAAGAFAGHFLALSQGFDTVQTAVIGGVIGFMIGAVGCQKKNRLSRKLLKSAIKVILKIARPMEPSFFHGGRFFCISVVIQ